MAFEFKRKETIRKAVKRLARKRVEKALCHLKHCDRLESVHQVRKQIKQLRALLRLVRTAMTRSDYRHYNNVLRDAAGQLSAARDAHVMVSALDHLAAGFRAELSSQSLGQITEILSAECRERQAELSMAKASRNVARLLSRLSRCVGSLKSKKSGWAAIGPGVRRSYRDGRRGYRLACRTGVPEHFHEWRKRAKDLLYQTGLLCRIWPEQMKALEGELKHLAEFLGDDHDLFLLAEHLANAKLSRKAPQEAALLKALIEKRQADLKSRALTLGARFYQEKPSAFCARLCKYWKRWRREPKRLMVR